MKRIITIYIMLILMLHSGCSSGKKKNGHVRKKKTQETAQKKDKLLNAAEHEKSGRHIQALKLFRDIRRRSLIAEERDLARFGEARCLMKMNRYAAAVSTLAPLPDTVSSANDRKRLTLCGEAFLRMNNPTGAESVLEVALSGYDVKTSYASWAAACCANLARAYLINDKPIQSARMYMLASVQFRATGRLDAAEECAKTTSRINTLLSQATINTDNH